ncbi:MAG: SipW-dependent-type signal peptide-containing protein [Propionibacteriaceae bacterium]|nr:SipW-dependent-type signal peptide-containing protein [Propionibacteriaceae bacterium]
MKKLIVAVAALILAVGLTSGDTYALWSQAHTVEPIAVGSGLVGFAVAGDHQENGADTARDAADLVFVSADEDLHDQAAGGSAINTSDSYDTCFTFQVEARADGNVGLDYEISLADTFEANTDPVFEGASIRVARDLDGDGDADEAWHHLDAGHPSTGAQSAVPALKAAATATHHWVACVTTYPKQQSYKNTAWVTVRTESGQVLSTSDSWEAKFRATQGPRLDLLQLRHEVFHA